MDLEKSDISFLKAYIKEKYGDEAYYQSYHIVDKSYVIMYLFKDVNNKVSFFGSETITKDKMKPFLRKIKLKHILNGLR